MSDDLVTLWAATARRLEGEDSRFCDLVLRYDRTTSDGRIVVEGPEMAVDLLMSNAPGTPAFQPVLRQLFRETAKSLGGWDAQLQVPEWPVFYLAASVVHTAEEDPAGEAIPPQTPPSGPPVFRVHPGGHETQPEAFKRIAREIGDLVVRKNEAYGNSFNESGEILRILYPSGIAPDQYDDALAVIRIIDKLKRISTDRDALGESPFRDIAGYGILGTEAVERKRRGR